MQKVKIIFHMTTSVITVSPNNFLLYLTCNVEKKLRNVIFDYNLPPVFFCLPNDC